MGTVEFRDVTIIRRDGKLHVYGLTHKDAGGTSGVIGCHVIDEDRRANGVAYLDAQGDMELLDLLILHVDPVPSETASR